MRKDELGETAHQSSRKCAKQAPRAPCHWTSSVDCLLQLLHRQHTHGLGGGLGLEDAWLLGERVDTLAGLSGGLRLQFHVELTCKFESASLLQLLRRQCH